MTDPRRVLVLAHTRRAEAREVARAFVKELTSHGIVVRLLRAEADALELQPEDYAPTVELTDSESDASRGCELTVVIGGDGMVRQSSRSRFRSSPMRLR